MDRIAASLQGESLLDFIEQSKKAEARDASATHDIKLRVHRNMGSKKKGRGTKTPEERERDARLFRKQNPQVWEAFVEMAKESVDFKDRFSAEAIFNILRWNTNKRGEDGSKYKINNNYKSFFARWFMQEYPQYGEIFETRGAA